MNREKVFGWLKRIITGLVLLAINLIAGATLGGLWVKLFVPRKAMGWDGLADMLGGLMVGALLGGVVTVLLVFLLSVRWQWVWIGGATVVAGLILTGLALTAPEREVSSEPILEKDFQPFFRATMRVTHTPEILEAVPPNERPFPFVEAEVFSGKPELIRMGWGPDFERCVATPSTADLEALLPYVQAASAAAGPFCRTPEDDLTVSVRWNVAGDSDGRGLDTGCLPDTPEFTALADAIDVLANQLCGSNGDQ
jgi:MFS family permease